MHNLILAASGAFTGSTLAVTVMGLHLCLGAAARRHPGHHLELQRLRQGKGYSGQENDAPTCYNALENQWSEVKPQNLKLLSLQASELRRNTFGHGKPVTTIESLDAEDNVVWKTSGMVFDGGSCTQYLEQTDAEPKGVRVTWYGRRELMTVPLETKATLGL